MFGKTRKKIKDTEASFQTLKMGITHQIHLTQTMQNTVIQLIKTKSGI